MPRTRSSISDPQLETVKQQFKTWRETREHKSRIPNELWEAAAGLYGQYSVHHLSKTLRLNHTSLKNRIAACKTNEESEPQQCFLELIPPQPSPVSSCLIEMENNRGEKMRMHFSGDVNLDLLALSKNFWVSGT